MFDLVFLFTGLCGFALDPPPSDHINSAEGLDVVLVKEPKHVAMLVVRQDAVDRASTLLPSRCYGDCHGHLGYYAYDLDQRIVRLRNRSASAETDVTWTPLSGEPECPDDKNAHSYGWVVPMSRVTPGEGKVLDGVRRPARTPPEPFRAVIQLERGYLSTVDFARDKEGQVIRWKFSRGWLPKIETALGDPTEVRQPEWKEQVEIEVVDVSTRQTDLLILKPPHDHESLLVEIFNSLEEEVCCRRPATDKVEPNHHFTHLYSLLPNNAVRSVPKVAKEPTCPDAPEYEPVEGSCVRWCPQPTYGNPQCPGADMSRP